MEFTNLSGQFFTPSILIFNRFKRSQQVSHLEILAHHSAHLFELSFLLIRKCNMYLFLLSEFSSTRTCQYIVMPLLFYVGTKRSFLQFSCTIYKKILKAWGVEGFGGSPQSLPNFRLAREGLRKMWNYCQNSKGCHWWQIDGLLRDGQKHPKRIPYIWYSHTGESWWMSMSVSMCRRCGPPWTCINRYLRCLWCLRNTVWCTSTRQRFERWQCRCFRYLHLIQFAHLMQRPLCRSKREWENVICLVTQHYKTI